MKAKVINKVEFPCGYKHENVLFFGTGFFDFVRIETIKEDYPVCPLHGKDCGKNPTRKTK